MSISNSRLAPRLYTRLVMAVAVIGLVLSMGGTWMSARPALAAPVTQPVSAAASRQPAASTAAGIPDRDERSGRPAKKEVTGKLNLNTATEEQLMMLPSVGPSKAER